MSTTETAILIVVVLVGVGAFFGIVLALADRKFYMQQNPLIAEVEDVLPNGEPEFVEHDRVLGVQVHHDGGVGAHRVDAVVQTPLARRLGPVQVLATRREQRKGVAGEGVEEGSRGGHNDLAGLGVACREVAGAAHDESALD
mgnify:CR=1 FL=1